MQRLLKAWVLTLALLIIPLLEQFNVQPFGTFTPWQAWAIAAYSNPNNPNCFPIQFYGGVGDGATANDTAFTTWKTSTVSGGGGTAYPCLYSPAGKYKFTATTTYTIASGNPTAALTVAGAASDTSVWDWGTASTQGLTATVNGQNQSVHVRDMTFATGVQSSTNAGLTLTQATTTIANPAATAQSDITRVTFRSNVGFSDTSFNWGNAVVINSVSAVAFDKMAIGGGAAYQTTLPSSGGNGVQLNGTSTAPGVQYNFTACNLTNLIYGVTLNNYVQGVTIETGCNFTAGYVGIYIAGTTGLEQLTVTGSQFENGRTALLENAGFNGQMFADNLFITEAGAVGLDFAAPTQSTIYHGNSFFGSGTNTGTGVIVALGTVLGYGNTYGNLAQGFTYTTGASAAYNDKFFGNTTNFTCGIGVSCEESLFTASNCSNGASPAVCSTARAGSVAIPAGVTQTLVVDSSAVTANSQILLTIDESATIAGTTCNTTIATLGQPVVTARTAGTSFTIEEPSTTTTNPVCVDYAIIN